MDSSTATSFAEITLAEEPVPAGKYRAVPAGLWPKLGKFWWLAALAIPLVAMALWHWLATPSRTPLVIPESAWYRLTPTDMDITVAKDGELSAVNNIDVICHVEGQNTIIQIVPEGASVAKGDVLVVLDSSIQRHKIEDITLDVEKSDADVKTAREMKEIQESQNATNEEAADVSLILAKLDMEQYTLGTYPQQVADARTSLEMAELTLKNKQDDMNNTNALFAKGFVTNADVKKAELDFTTAQNGVDKAKTALEVLTKYTHAMDEASKKNALMQAEQKLIRTRKENASNLAQRIADLHVKEQTLVINQRKLSDAKEQLDNCTIKAPADGLVVYASSFDRNAQQPIQEGATVRDKQLLLRLPDTRSMKAVVRIGEAQVQNLRVDEHDPMRAMVKIVGLAQPIGASIAKISVLADNSNRWWNPDLKEYPVDLVLDETPPNLKPGERADARIFVRTVHDAMASPLDALYAAGPDTYVFVRGDGSEPRPVKVEVGSSNENLIEIKSDQVAGREILRLQVGQGRALLERNGIAVKGTPDMREKAREKEKPQPKPPVVETKVE